MKLRTLKDHSQVLSNTRAKEHPELLSEEELVALGLFTQVRCRECWRYRRGKSCGFEPKATGQVIACEGYLRKED